MTKALPTTIAKNASLYEVFIYGLYCPLTDELRYVGKANNVNARLKSHLSDSRTRKTPVYCWIRSLLKNDLVPDIKVIEVADENSWVEAEIRLIAKFRSSGRLLNLAEGGDQPSQTTEQRRKNALSMHAKFNAKPKDEQLAHLRSNAAIMNNIVANKPDREKALHQLKRRIARFYSEAKISGKASGDWSLAERMRVKMVEFYEKRPSMFKSWADLKSVSHLQEVAA